MGTPPATQAFDGVAASRTAPTVRCDGENTVVGIRLHLVRVLTTPDGR